VLAHIIYLQGDLERAQQQTKALEETHRSEMVFLFGGAQRLLGEIQAAKGVEQEADHFFEQALQTFKQYGHASIMHEPAQIWLLPAPTQFARRTSTRIPG